MFNVGINVGGTFTDFVYLDNTTGEFSWRKVPTTPDDWCRASSTVSEIVFPI